MDIRFISSMTVEDEARVAAALLDFVSAFLDSMPVAYTLRVDTSAGLRFQRTHPTLRVTSGSNEPPPR